MNKDTLLSMDRLTLSTVNKYPPICVAHTSNLFLAYCAALYRLALQHILLCNTMPVKLHIKTINQFLKEYWSTSVSKYDILLLKNICTLFWLVHIVCLTYLFHFIVHVWILELIRWRNVQLYKNECVFVLLLIQFITGSEKYLHCS